MTALAWNRGTVEEFIAELDRAPGSARSMELVEDLLALQEPEGATSSDAREPDHRVFAAIDQFISRFGPETGQHDPVVLGPCPPTERADLRRLLHTAPDSSRTHELLARLLKLHRLDAPARRHYERSLALDSSSWTARSDYAILLARLGETGRAIDAWRAMVDERPEDDHLELMLGMAYEAHGDLPSAIEQYRRSIQHHAEWHRRRRWSLLHWWLGRGLERDLGPSFHGADRTVSIGGYRHLAGALEKMGDVSGAREAWERLSRAYPAGPVAARASRKLADLSDASDE